MFTHISYDTMSLATIKKVTKESVILVEKTVFDYVKEHFKYTTLENYNGKLDDKLELQKEYTGRKRYRVDSLIKIITKTCYIKRYINLTSISPIYLCST